MEDMKKEIQNLKKKILYSTAIYVVTIIIYNFSLIQCLIDYSQIRSYYREILQVNQELSESLQSVSLQYQQIVEDYEEFQQFLHQK